MSADAESIFRENLSLVICEAKVYGASSYECRALEDAFFGWRERYLSYYPKLADFGARFDEWIMLFIGRRAEEEGSTLDEYLDEPPDASFVGLVKEATDDFLRVSSHAQELKAIERDLSAMLAETIEAVLEHYPASAQAVRVRWSFDLDHQRNPTRFLIPEIEMEGVDGFFGVINIQEFQRLSFSERAQAVVHGNMFNRIPPE